MEALLAAIVPIVSSDTQAVKKGRGSNTESSSNLKSTVSLSVLGLIGNGLTDRGAFSAAAALASKHCPLTRLYLNENAIGDEGACALAAAVSVSSASATSSTAAAAAALTTAAATATATDGQKLIVLERLGLSDNFIGEAGGEALLACLAQGSSLEKLCASDNPFGDEVAIPSYLVLSCLRSHTYVFV